MREQYQLDQSVVSLSEIDPALLTIGNFQSIFKRNFLIYIDKKLYPQRCQGFSMTVVYSKRDTDRIKYLGTFPFQDEGPLEDQYICYFFPIWDFEYMAAIEKVAKEPAIFSLPDNIENYFALSYFVNMPPPGQGVSMQFTYDAAFISQ